MVSAFQVWNPDDWESFVLGLLHARHSALTVHKIPAKHNGDLGIDYYCPDACVVYQCYSVQEPVDIITRADKQKIKITADLSKLIANASDISKLFLGNKIKHWILVVPAHDSKDVNLHCAKKTLDLRKGNYEHLDASFEVSIQDQSSFSASAVADGLTKAAEIKLSVPTPSPDEISDWSAGSPDLLANASVKLAKRLGTDDLPSLVTECVQWFMEGSALLDALRSGAPDLHDKIVAAIASRSRRLRLSGPQGGPEPGAILSTELEALVAAVRTAAPNLEQTTAEQIAFGTISDWIMRCPLDFPDYAT